MTDPFVTSEQSAESEGLVIMGRVTGLHGVRGWVKVHSYTRDHLDILEYDHWRLRLAGAWREIEVKEGRPQGRGIVVHLKGYDDRDQATTLVGADIAVPRAQLPRLKQGEYYWSQLEGLRVTNLQGVELGRVSHLFETGSNDVLVVVGEREYLIPYLPDVVQVIDLDAGTLRVDWDADF
jgi:16S rRNA processing protein RimM